jgi:hypothetical protein
MTQERYPGGINVKGRVVCAGPRCAARSQEPGRFRVGVNTPYAAQDPQFYLIARTGRAA